MTITINPDRNEYTSGPGQTVFNYDFKIYTENDLIVYLTPAGQEADDSADVIAGYSVTGVGDENGGTITLSSGASSGDLITIVSDIPSNRTVDYQNNGDFIPSTVNADIDRTVSLNKQAEGIARRSLLFPESAQNVTSSTLPLPIANHFVRWKPDLSGMENVAPSTGTPPISQLSVVDYTALLALDPNDFTSGDIVYVTQPGIAGTFVLTAGAEGNGNGGTIISDSTWNTAIKHWDRRYDGVVNAQWFLAYDGSTDDAGQLLVLLQSGFKEIHFPDGTVNIETAIDAVLTANLRLFGPGLLSWGGVSTTNEMLNIDCNDFDLDFGLNTEGNNLISAGLVVTNDTAMSGDLPTCTFRDGEHKDFMMNTASIYNEAVFVEGSYALVELCHNNVHDISRAAGTGTPGSTGTSGMSVLHKSSTFYARKVLVHNNRTSQITSGDAAGANDVDIDGLRVLMPDPTNFDNTDTTVNEYPLTQVESHSNTYTNCRGRAEKYQCIPHSHHNTVIRDGDRTMNGASVEINCQWGVGNVHDIDFRYQDFDSGGVTSPITTELNLVSFFQGSGYGERKVGASVRNLRVVNEISDAVKNNLDVMVTFQTGATAQDVPVPLMSVKNLEMTGGEVNNIVRTSFITAATGLLVMKDISVPVCNFGAIGSGNDNPDISIDASGIVNVDGIAGTKVRFVSDFTGGSRSWNGDMVGYGNYGWENTYNRGADTLRAPKLEGAALSDGRGDKTGGAFSVQSNAIADDATEVFELRGYVDGDHTFVVSTSFGNENSAGMFYSAGVSASITQMTTTTGTLFSLGTGSNPDVDGDINMWIDGSGQLNIKNRLGSNRVFTIWFIG